MAIYTVVFAEKSSGRIFDLKVNADSEKSAERRWMLHYSPGTAPAYQVLYVRKLEPKSQKQAYKAFAEYAGQTRESVLKCKNCGKEA